MRCSPAITAQQHGMGSGKNLQNFAPIVSDPPPRSALWLMYIWTERRYVYPSSNTSRASSIFSRQTAMRARERGRHFVSPVDKGAAEATAPRSPKPSDKLSLGAVKCRPLRRTLDPPVIYRDEEVSSASPRSLSSPTTTTRRVIAWWRSPF